MSGSAHVVVDTVGTYTSARRPAPRTATTHAPATTCHQHDRRPTPHAAPRPRRRRRRPPPRTTTHDHDDATDHDDRRPRPRRRPRPPTTTPTTTTPTTTTTSRRPVPTNPEAGAQLPISYDLAAEPNRLFVSPSGLDTNPGTVSQPLATLSAAVARATSGYRTTIVVRGGTYRQGQVSLPAQQADHPHRLPRRDARVHRRTTAHRAPGPPMARCAGTRTPTCPSATAAGSRSRPARTSPVTRVGKYADQAWIGTHPAAPGEHEGRRGRRARSGSTPPSDRIYLTAADSAAAGHRGVEAPPSSSRSTPPTPGWRASPSAATRTTPACTGRSAWRRPPTGCTIRDVVIEDAAYQAIQLAGSSDILDEVTIERTTITGSNWMGVAASLTDDLTLDRVLITGDQPLGRVHDVAAVGRVEDVAHVAHHGVEQRDPRQPGARAVVRPEQLRRHRRQQRHHRERRLPPSSSRSPTGSRWSTTG